MAGSTFGYARPADGAYIAYRVDGDGPVDFVWQPDWPGNIDGEWEDPLMGTLLTRLTELGRVITHDHRGVGLSSRDVELPTLETRVADLMAVIDTADVRRPVMIGVFSSGAINAMVAAMRPKLPRALVWWEPGARSAWAPDYPWGRRWEELDRENALLSLWGTEDYGRAVLEFEASLGNVIPDAAAASLARQGRNACTPDVAAAMARIWYDTDVRGVLPSVQVPTLLMVHEDREGSLAQVQAIADLMPAAKIRAMPGDAWKLDEMPAWIDEIRRFVGDDLPATSGDTVLSTVLFTDIVDSTATQARIGDRAWKDLIESHHAIVRRLLERHGGIEQDTAGDGFFARFDGPARAIRCAREVSAGVREIGVQIRAGVHTGECQIADGKCSGLAVTIGARVMAHAGASQVLVSQTVKDLVAGSGLAFEDAGEHELKGVPDTWRLYRVVS